MNFIVRKILKKSIVPLVVFSPLILASCASASSDATNELSNWDNEITLNYRWENSDKWDKNAFLKLLSDNFNKLKNEDERLKSLPDVKFNLNIIGDANKTLQDLKSDKPDVDLGIVPYYSFEDEKIDQNFPVFVAQTGTLKFKWGAPDNTFYVDGSDKDPLRLTAERENKLQFSQPFGEFKNWKDTKETYGWDGSKYQSFYDTNKYTYVYRGSILISGTEQELTKIKKDWDDKNWDAFVSNGIIFRNFSSGGKFKYQAAILARHFSERFKNINEVNDYFINRNNQNNLLTGKDADSIGKLQGDKIFNIAFDDEGAFNWTPKQWGTHLYNPTNQNAVVRVLTVTNPAPYDAVLGRVGLNKIQAQLIGKALESIKGDQNTLGIYTGYNYFKSGDSINFNDFLKLQQFTTNSSVTKPNMEIPKIEE